MLQSTTWNSSTSSVMKELLEAFTLWSSPSRVVGLSQRTLIWRKTVSVTSTDIYVPSYAMGWFSILKLVMWNWLSHFKSKGSYKLRGEMENNAVWLGLNGDLSVSNSYKNFVLTENIIHVWLLKIKKKGQKLICQWAACDWEHVTYFSLQFEQSVWLNLRTNWYYIAKSLFCLICNLLVAYRSR